MGVRGTLSNLQSFTKVPKSGNLSQYQLLLHLVFSPLGKNVEVFTYKIMNWPSRTYAAPCHFFCNDSRGGLFYKPGGFLRSPRHYVEVVIRLYNIVRVLLYLIPIGVIMVHFSTYARPCIHEMTCAKNYKEIVFDFHTRTILTF